MSDMEDAVVAAEAPAKGKRGRSAKAKPAAAAVVKKTTGRKKSSSPKPKASAAATHPKTSEMVLEAIENMQDKTGSSLAAIKKYIQDNFGAEIDKKLANQIKKFLVTAVQKEELIQTKGKGAAGSFKLATKSSSSNKRQAVEMRTPEKKAPAAAKKAASKKAPSAKVPSTPPAKKTTPTPPTPKKKEPEAESPVEVSKAPAKAKVATKTKAAVQKKSPAKKGRKPAKKGKKSPAKK